MSNALTFDENATCEGCGRFGAYQFEGERVCAGCYELRGSCCPEFGRDDLWRERQCVESPVEPPAPQPEHPRPLPK